MARDYRLWIAGCSNVGPITGGPWRGRSCIGCSLVVGPDGQPRARGPCGATAEAMLIVDVSPEPRPARGDGWNSRREVQTKNAGGQGWGNAQR